MKTSLVYIVENDSEYRKILLKNLREINGIEVKAFQSIESAFYNLSVKPDFIILDQTLAKTRGIDYIPICREILPEAKILIVSAREDISTFVSAFDFGANEYIKKDGYEIARIMVILKNFLMADEEVAEPGMENPFTGDNFTKKGKSIYLLEDDSSAAFFIEHLLTSETNNKVTAFTRSAEFINQLSKSKPDIIILDYNLQEKENGLDLLKRIKKEFADVAVIILSGQKNAAVVTELMREGASYYFVKSKESYLRFKSIVGSL